MVSPVIQTVISDIDGTLISKDERISPRLYSCLSELEKKNISLILASGRPPRWILPIIKQIPQNPVCICANGAVVWDSAQDRILYAAELMPEDMKDLYRRIENSTVPCHWSVAVERVGTSAFDRPEKLFATSKNYYHAWDSEEHQEQEIEDLLGEPAVKMLIRGRGLTSAQLWELIHPLVPESMTLTYSWPGSVQEGGLVELSAYGISKGATLEYLAGDGAHILSNSKSRITAQNSIAFGDMPNDYEMLKWAGIGVAMGQAPGVLKAIADKETATPEEEGVAQVLEEMLGIFSTQQR